MLVANRKNWVIHALSAATVCLVAPAVQAEARTQIRGISHHEQDGVTTIRIRGSEALVFTAYKLERPARVVIDVAQAALSDALRGPGEGAAMLTAPTWAVSGLSAQQIEDGNNSVRLTVTLARPGRYDVKTDGADLVLTFTARDVAPKTYGEADVAAVRARASEAQADAAKAKAATAAANADAERAKAAAATARAEAERLRTQAAESAARAAQAEKALAAANAQRGTAAAGAIANAQKAAEQARQDAARANARAETARNEAAAAATKAQQALAAAEAARRDEARAKDQAVAQAQAATAEAAKARSEAATAQSELARVKADAAAQMQAAARERAGAEALAAQANKQLQAAAAREKAAAAAEAAAREKQAVAAKAAATSERDARASEVSKAEKALAQAKVELERARRDREQAQAEAAAAVAAAQTAQRDAEAARLAELQAKTARTVALSEAQQAQTARTVALSEAQQAQKARHVALADAQNAEAQKRAAEASVAELATKRVALEQAMATAERQRNESARKELEVQQANARSASQREIAQLQAEAKALRDETNRANAELAQRRADVAAQQALVAKLEQRANLAAVRPAVAAGPAAPSMMPAKGPVSPQLAPVAATAKALAAVTDVTFNGNQDISDIGIVLRGDGQVKLGNASELRAELLIEDSQLAQTLERKLDVSRFGGPVRAVSSFRDRTAPNRVRVIVDLATPATPSLVNNGGVWNWRFAATDAASRTATAATKSVNLPPPTVSSFGTNVAQAQSTANASKRKVFRGQPVDLDFKDAPIHDLLRLLSEVGRVNIVVPDDINDKVTVRMKRVPWDQALEVILSSKGLWYRRDGNLFRVAKRSLLDEEDEKEAARRRAAIEAEAPEPEVITLNYASATGLKAKLEPLSSPKGKIETDDRTNALVVSDLRANRQRIKELALQLDTQTPQISIEARIVEARSNFRREFGIQWGGGGAASIAGGNATGLQFPSSVAVAGGTRDNNTPLAGLASPTDFAVNMPAAVGLGTGGALGVSLGSIGGNLNLGLRLSAMEDTGTVRIISAPKITVLNNEQADISQGTRIPIQVTGAQGTQTSFVNADLALSVKPYVSLRDCAIAMEINVTKNEPDFVNKGARGDPSILTKEAKTKILVNDGETTVMGGIYTRNTGLSYNKIPFFSDLPVLGWLFKRRSENDDRTEVLVFITPRITNKAFLRCQ